MRNLKRVVEVWLDEYKFLFYRNHPERKDIDAGDLTEAIEVRKKLNCKPFKYYLEKVAPHILERFPIHPRADFASGAIQSLADKNLCMSQSENHQNLKLENCSRNLEHPETAQSFNLTWHRMITINDDTEMCFDNTVIWPCHWQQGIQMFRYLLVVYLHHIFSASIISKFCRTHNK